MHRERRTTLVQNFVCDNTTWNIPKPLVRPERTDYLTDEESDEGAGFSLKIPALGDLISEFEQGDGVMDAREVSERDRLADLKARGFKPEQRSEMSLLRHT